MTKPVILFFVLLLFTASCINEDFEETINNSRISPTFSIPIGAIDYSISEDFNIPSSPVPGPFGIVFYEDKPYTLNSPYIIKEDTVDYNFQLNAKWFENSDWAEYHLYIESELPTEGDMQIYFINNEYHIVDSLGRSGPIVIQPGKTDNNGIVIGKTATSCDYPLTKEQINGLTNIVFYYQKGTINTINNLGEDSVKFYQSNKITFHLGLRIRMNLRVNQL